ncbi:MAG: LPS export ABC transporter periplasmic protein LptC [Gammaproteobacteria bacterium]
MNAPEPKTFLTLGLLLILAMVSIYIAQDNQSKKEDQWRVALSMAYYLKDAELRSTGADGIELFRIKTRRAAQKPDESGINLTKVDMIYGPPATMAWDLTANSGFIPRDTSIIELYGDVVAVSESNNNSRTTIRTQRLDIDPTTKQANTNERVQLDFNGRIVNAKGMEANFETNDLKLLSNVSGKFHP